MTTEKKRAGSVISVKKVLIAGTTDQFKLQIKLHGTPSGDGEMVPVLEELNFDPALCSAECRKFAEYHGWEQRLRDAAAKPVDQKTGKAASPREKFAAIKKLADFYLSGTKEWNLRSGAAPGPRESDDKQMLKAALGEYFPTVNKERTPEQIHIAVEAMDKGKVSALLAQPDIAAIVLKLREEKAVEMEVDAEELLEGM